jgi:4a-hydroxytetrahydrobiopterin dehydratase
MPTAPLLAPDEIATQLADLPGWRFAEGALRRSIVAPDFPSAIAILDDVAVVAEEMDHHPDVDLRWRTLHVALSTHSAGGVTSLDIELAHRFSAIAVEHGVRTDDAVDHKPALGLCIDCTDPGALVRWWAAALRYVERDGSLYDPEGHGPFVWFQPVPEPKRGKNRLHLDLLLPRHEAAARRDLLVAMGGHVLDERETFWVLADPEGNEVCVCVEE